MSGRARVPFALIGVLLLVTSGTVAVTQHGPAAQEPSVDRALDRLTAESHTALRAAIREAAREAARRPVVRPANTTVGDALREDRAFEDALRLRIYLTARRNLAAISGDRRDVDLAASLPPIDDAGDARAAIDRVAIERAGPDGHQLRVGIEGVALRARRHGQLVGETRDDPAFVVDVPVLVVHDRVERFEARLNAYVGQPGLASRLTGRLYPVAWARGYAQFRGGPIENVVSNRHVALLTNGALLREQRAVFGSSDPVGRQVYAASLAETAVTALVARSDSRTLELLDQYRGAVGLDSVGDEALATLEPDPGAPRPDDEVTVEVGETADLAYLRAVRTLNETLDAAYRPRVRIRADVRTVDRRTVDTHEAVPGGTLAGERTVVSTTVLNRSGSQPVSAAGWHRLAGFSRTVIVEETTIYDWTVDENESETTTSTDRIRKEVDLVVEGDHAVGPAPPGPVTTVHARGGPFDGPNLVDARERLLAAGVTARGGADELASRAATGRSIDRPIAVQAPRPSELAAWARPDLGPLRSEVRAVAVAVPRGEIGSFRTNVARRLADRLRERRDELIDAPATYHDVAHRARVGVRAAYVDRVVGILERRATAVDQGRQGIDDALETTSGRAQSVLADAYAARDATTSPVTGGDLRMVVDTSPSYLARQAVGHDAVPVIPAGQREHPLVVRNQNGFGIPVADVLETLFGLLEGQKTASLRSAARVLAIQDEVATAVQSTEGDGTVLRRQVARTNRWGRNALVAVLNRRGLGSDGERARIVDRALAEWNGTAARGAALANGSAATAVHEAALDRWPGAFGTSLDRELLAIQLRFAAREARSTDAAQPTMGAVNGTARQIRERVGVGGAARETLATFSQSQAARIAARLPKGVPVVPGPGTWYATVNVWQVQVRGSYARFAVRVRQGAPDVVPPDMAYVRENRTIRIDVDADSDRERIGHNERIGVTAETVVGVAVPPGPQGVGDVGELDEQSPGWPTPGPVGRNATAR